MSQPYVLQADSQNWSQSYAGANFLLKEGVKVLWATEPFTADVGAGLQAFDRGTFLIPDVSAQWLKAVEQRYGIPLQSANALDGFVALQLQPLRIAMYGGGGAPFNHARIFAELGFFVDFITPQEVRQGKLADFDVLGMPGGGGIAMKGQLDPLGADGCRKVADFVRDGGMYMGSCAGAFDAAIVSESFLAVCPQQRGMQLVNSQIWNRNDTEWVGLNSPGVGVLESRNLHPDHPVMFGLPERFRITHYNGPFFEPLPGAIADASQSIGLAAVAGFTEDFTPSEYFLRFGEYDTVEAERTTIVGQAAREGRFNIVAGLYGSGKVVLFGSHPEFGYNLGMDQWDVPARMLANAAFWQSARLSEPRPMKRKPVYDSPRSFPSGSGLARVNDWMNAIAGAVDQLRQVGHEAWLDEGHAMSTFGMSGNDIWASNLKAFDDIAAEMKQTLNELARAVSEAPSMQSALAVSQEPETSQAAEALQDALLGLEEAIHYRTPAEWNQDFGYEGVLQMLDRAYTMLCAGFDAREQVFEYSDNPYQYFDRSPYQLVVGSYLAAIGVFANAWFLSKVHLLRLDELLFKGRILLS